MINRSLPLPKLTENIIIIEVARQFIKEKELKVHCFDKINYIRIHKRMILPVELVGARGRKQTEICDKIEARSLLK